MKPSLCLALGWLIVLPRLACAQVTLDDTQKLGQRLFEQSCGICHTRPTLVSGLYGPALSKEAAGGRTDVVRDVISKVQRDGLFSAIQAVRSRLDQPQNPGYSSAGTVIAVGDGVTDIQAGDRVACAGAGFAVHAEIACVPRLLVARIPARDAATKDEVPFDEAAFATLGAVALHGIRTAEAKLGDLVAVIGLGLLGQLAVQLLKAAGCHVLGMDIQSSGC